MTNEWFETDHAPPHNEIGPKRRHRRQGKSPGIPSMRILTDATDSFAGLYWAVPNQAGCDRLSSCGFGETSLVTRSVGGLVVK